MSRAHTASVATLEADSSDPGLLLLRLAGHLDTRSAGDVWAEAEGRVGSARSERVVVEASGLTYCDGGGVALIMALEASQRASGGSFELRGFPAGFQPILDLVRRAEEERGAPASPPPSRNFVTMIGHEAVDIGRDLVQLIRFSGEVVAAMVDAVLRPHRVRWKDVLRTIQEAGVRGFPVVFLISFLLGLILAYQTVGSLQKYGAEVYLADMIGISMIRELGPLMTAIMLAARSGSAFAAEIGTMKVNEEVDALTTMGLDPVRFLTTPRIIAAVLVTPILTLSADVAGIVGALVVWLGDLDYPISLFHTHLVEAVSVGDLLGGLFKALVFGILVAAIGCIRGMQTRGGAIAVGKSTTSAVVSGLILIAIADMLLAVVYYHMGW